MSIPAGARPPLTLGDFAAIPVSELRGVGEAKAAKLAAVEIHSLLDLLTHYPRRYLDRTKQARIAELAPGAEATLLVRVERVDTPPARGRGKRRVEVVVGDGSGRIRCTFFNQPWRAKQLRPGMEVLVYGKSDVFRGRLQMTNPVVDLIGDRTGRIVPVYPQSEKAGVTTWELADLVGEALRRSRVRGLAEPLPEPLRRARGLVDRQSAFEAIHAPEAMADQAAARHRLAFEELLRVQLALVLRKRAIERSAAGIAHVVDGDLVRRFHAGLPFPLTKAQQRAIAEIETDQARPVPMHRLLQGDVGAGKTLVAVSAMLVAVQGGHQAALMAPTEVLAEQHFLGIRDLVHGLSVPGREGGLLFGGGELRVALLTNRTTAGERARLADELARGEVDLLIGTHALIQEGVRFASLGVVVIDEQHRFGVEQRAALRAKGERDGEADGGPGGGPGVVPDVLVMTATPIPRTAAMTVYGDLDVSVLDELPPGRTPITTRWVRDPLAEHEVWDHVRAEVGAGRQAYVVCPLIEESEKLEVASAQETYDRLVAGELHDLRVGLLHGRMTSREKEQTMASFRAGTLDVLVSTTVIEVGVDVPNATVMVILDADRFGLAQLHQLRGRVGRGAHASTCFLLGDATTEVGEERLRGFEAETDGFRLAELDLELRGEGTIMGTQQKGRSDLKLASLRRDRSLVEQAREAAFELVDADPTLASHPQLVEELRLFIDDDEAEFLFKS